MDDNDDDDDDDEQKVVADSETRERSSILGKFRNMEHQVSGFNDATS